MLYGYPHAFLEKKEDLKTFHLDSEEKNNIDWVPVKFGEIN